MPITDSVISVITMPIAIIFLPNFFSEYWLIYKTISQYVVFFLTRLTDFTRLPPSSNFDFYWENLILTCDRIKPDDAGPLNVEMIAGVFLGRSMNRS